MSVYLSLELRRLLDEADDGQCVYCQTTVDNTGQALTTDHILPVAAGGETVFANLCRACRRCNEAKHDQTHAIDPLTNERVLLYHPRRQPCSEHFVWDQTGIRLLGLTAIGRATIIALDMNNEVMVFARRRWVNAGWHPPRRP